MELALCKASLVEEAPRVLRMEVGDHRFLRESAPSGKRVLYHERLYRTLGRSARLEPGRDRPEHDVRVSHDDAEHADRDYAHKQGEHPAPDDAGGLHRRARLYRAGPCRRHPAVCGAVLHRVGVRADLRRRGRHHADEPLVRRLPGPGLRAGRHGDIPFPGRSCRS